MLPTRRNNEIMRRNDVSFGGLTRRAEEIMNLIDDYDKRMLGYIVDLSKAAGGNTIMIDKIENIIQALQQYNAENEYEYLNCLLHPECAKGVKIPSPIPVPSCAFQLHNTITLTTSGRGNLCFLFNPFFLYDRSLNGKNIAVTNTAGEEPVTSNDQLNYITTFLFNNSSNLDGSTPSVSASDWVPLDIGQGIPNVYNQYRLVSASIVIRYIGRMDITSGVIGGAIIYDDSLFPAYSVTGSTDRFFSNNIFKYSNFDTAMDSFYHQERNCVEGLREIYFPIDNSYEEYKRFVANLEELPYGYMYGGVQASDDVNLKTNVFSSVGNGFQQMVYVLGAPPDTSCFKVDIYCNFETLPNATFLNYMPVSVTPKTISPEVKKETLAIVQKNPITDLKNKPKWFGNIKNNIFSGLKRVFNNSISKALLENLAPKILPFYKPALSLYNLYQSNQMGNVDNSFQKLNPNVPALMDNDQNMDDVD